MLFPYGLLCSSCFPNHLLPVFTAQSCCTAFFQGSVAKLRKKIIPRDATELASRSRRFARVLWCRLVRSFSSTSLNFPSYVQISWFNMVGSFLADRSVIILILKFEVPRDWLFQGAKNIGFIHNASDIWILWSFTTLHYLRENFFLCCISLTSRGGVVTLCNRQESKDSIQDDHIWYKSVKLNGPCYWLCRRGKCKDKWSLSAH